ncbi:hypothetical protein WHR41_01523 [Cladosporium halotolerans]|uniref:Alpha/beta hydrolase fold-3 domain-containing protein n=1 Tax=Cladosporium halotolerans TaxID=1052096 RepID=A0AB34L1K9_9PEZI
MSSRKSSRSLSEREATNGSNNNAGANSAAAAAAKPGSIEVTHRTDRSLLMYILHTCIRPFGPKITNIQCELPPGSPQLEIPKSASRRCNVVERKVNDVYIYDCTTKKNVHVEQPGVEKVRQKRIYYFAGGGWRMPASADHWAFVSHLSANLPNTTLSLISYPLAPKNPAPDTIPKLLELLPTLLRASADANETTILAGDSAGANLALALPLELLRASLADPQTPDPPLLPSHILVLGPSVDLRRSNPAIPQLERHDPLLRHAFIKATSDVWRGDWPADDTRCSPLLVGDEVLAALAARGVQLHGVTGGFDILTPDGLLLRGRLEEAGIRGKWLHWEKQMHVFPLAFRWGLKESREGKNWVLDVLRAI